MALVVFQPVTPGETGVINIGGGVSFDIGAALVSGGGQITVDSVAQPNLYNALLQYRGLFVSGSTPGTPVAADTVGPLVVHYGQNPQENDILVRGADGLFKTATSLPNSQLPSQVASVASDYAVGKILNTKSLRANSTMRPEMAIRELKRNILLLPNGTGTFSDIAVFPEQFYLDATTGAMYMIYFGSGTGSNGLGLAKASGTPSSPAVADPTVNPFIDLGPMKASGLNMGGDSAHLVVANNTYFIFAGHNTAQGSEIYVWTAPQITAGAIVPLENAVWANAVVACYPGASNPGSFAAAQGGAGSLPNSLQTFGITALDHDGLEGGLVTTTITPTTSSAVTLTWTAPATGEYNGYNIYRNGQRIATIAHGTLTYSVTGAEALGVAAPAWTRSSCTRLDEMFVGYDDIAGQWRMLVMGMDPTNTYEQTHLANLTGAGYAALVVGATSFVKQNGGQPILPAGNYAAAFGTAIPGGSGMATIYDYENTADPFFFKVGKGFVIGYSFVRQGNTAAGKPEGIAAAYTTAFTPATTTKLGIMIHAPAAKNPADIALGVALDSRGQNACAAANWRGSLYVDEDGIGHIPFCGKLANGSNKTQGYYGQYDLSGLRDVILGIRDIDPWRRVEAESSDPRLTFNGWTTLTGVQPWLSGGGLGGSGGNGRYCTHIGDSVTFTFLGSAVRFDMGRVLTTGSVTVTLDGGGTEGVNQFTAIDLTSTVAGTWMVFHVAQFDNLKPGLHQLKVTAVTLGASGLFLDCFDYIPLLGQPA